MAARGPVIAIIGGGASGTLAAIHLLRAATARQYPLRIALIDRLGRHGLGEAYSTTSPAHFLNALTGRMSGVAGDPGHLQRWAGAAGLGSLEFLPRQAFGRYLQETLAEAQRAAAPLSRLSLITSEVLGIRPATGGHPMRVLLAHGATLEADLAILATGNLPPSPPVPFPDSPWCITNPWAPGALDAVQDGRPVIILGTGLTMLDVATAVTGDPRTTVRAVSRHGMLPQVHRGRGAPARLHLAARPVGHWRPGPAAGTHLADPGGHGQPAQSLAGRGRCSTAACAEPVAAAARPGQAAVRPARGPLLGGAPAPDAARDRAADHRAALYRAAIGTARPDHRDHRGPRRPGRPARHRPAPAPACPPRARPAEPERLRIRVEQDSSVTDLGAGWLINATGPDTDLTRTTDPLLRDLLGRGLARPDPLRLGLDASPDGAVLDAAGTPSTTLFTLGPPLRGVRYETTAIPEIRDQAAALAGLLTAAPPARQYPGSAA